jgi:hypothetical protein
LTASPLPPWLRPCPQAYSVHNDRVGYVRAMNVIVGLMLVSLNRNEEAAFWLLAALVRKGHTAVLATWP